MSSSEGLPRDRYCHGMSASPQTLSLAHRRVVAWWAADCAASALAIFEDASPDDARVRVAIDQARAFARGGIAVAEAIRRRGGAAGASAREAPTPAATAAAYSAEQAAAVAHMGAHALGAAGYAVKARLLTRGSPAGQGADADILAEVRGQVELMSPEVVNALELLPTLGTNGAGPLAEGRLSRGVVGEAIRELQAEVGRRARP